MPPLAIVLVVLGVALIVAALAGGWLLGQAMTGRARGIVRVVVGLIGIAAIVSRRANRWTSAAPCSKATPAASKADAAAPMTPTTLPRNAAKSMASSVCA